MINPGRNPIERKSAKPANRYSYPQLAFKLPALAPGQTSIGTGGQYSIGANSPNLQRKEIPTAFIAGLSLRGYFFSSSWAVVSWYCANGDIVAMRPTSGSVQAKPLNMRSMPTPSPNLALNLAPYGRWTAL
jgi:hypothetical protein